MDLAESDAVRDDPVRAEAARRNPFDHAGKHPVVEARGEERELLAGELLLHDARGLGREAEEPDARRRGGETDRLLEQARMAHRVDDEGGSGNAETDERVAESLARR